MVTAFLPGKEHPGTAIHGEHANAVEDQEHGKQGHQFKLATSIRLAMKVSTSEHFKSKGPHCGPFDSPRRYRNITQQQ
jgi:hypothetical protein